MPMLEAKNVSAVFGKHVVFENVSLKLSTGKIYCITGPSGCGKTTLGRILGALQRPTSGEVCFDTQRSDSHKIWPVQYLYQSPLTAMNPRWKIKKIIEEPGPVDTNLAHLLGIESDWDDRYPHELSGGQLQRVSILRALGAKPSFLIADEITSALDPVAQSQIWHLLLALIDKYKLGVVAISHDESLLSRISHASNHFRLGA
ncbi:ABC transporter ATP-binding protein [Brucella gallinifaecis]|nr:ATP-binding cassette domain-containing protein [Brucella gallinifaecis]